MMGSERRGAIITTFVMLGLGVTIGTGYWPGLHGLFVFDDISNIVTNSAVARQSLHADALKGALASNQSGVFKRPLAALSFALNHYASGGFESAFSFKLTNVVIHALNSGLIYWLCYLLCTRLDVAGAGDRWPRVVLSGLVSAAWALHPLQLTSVLYVVQRMNTLSALFVLLGLIAFFSGRNRVDSGRPFGFVLMTSGLLGGTGLGLSCKENAALLPLFTLVIELTCFDTKRLSAGMRRCCSGGGFLSLRSQLCGSSRGTAWSPA